MERLYVCVKNTLIEHSGIDVLNFEQNIEEDFQLNQNDEIVLESFQMPIPSCFAKTWMNRIVSPTNLNCRTLINQEILNNEPSLPIENFCKTLNVGIQHSMFNAIYGLHPELIDKIKSPMKVVVKQKEIFVEYTNIGKLFWCRPYFFPCDNKIYQLVGQDTESNLLFVPLKEVHQINYGGLILRPDDKVETQDNYITHWICADGTTSRRFIGEKIAGFMARIPDRNPLVQIGNPFLPNVNPTNKMNGRYRLIKFQHNIHNVPFVQDFIVHIYLSNTKTGEELFIKNDLMRKTNINTGYQTDMVCRPIKHTSKSLQFNRIKIMVEEPCEGFLSCYLGQTQCILAFHRK